MRPKGGQCSLKKPKGASKEPPKTPNPFQESQECPQETPQSTKNIAKMAPTTPTWAPRPLHERTYVENVETSRNTITRGRITCAPRPWTPPEEAKSTPKVGQKLLWRGQRALESLKRTSREPFESHWDTFGSRGEARAQKVTSPGPGPAIEETRVPLLPPGHIYIYFFL